MEKIEKQQWQIHGFFCICQFRSCNLSYIILILNQLQENVQTYRKIERFTGYQNTMLLYKEIELWNGDMLEISILVFAFQGYIFFVFEENMGWHWRKSRCFLLINKSKIRREYFENISIGMYFQVLKVLLKDICW